MAYTPTPTGRKVLQHLRTTKTDEQIIALLPSSAALGEIVVKMGTGETADAKKADTSLWVLAADDTTPVKFLSAQAILGISGDIITYVNTVSGNIENTILNMDKDASAETGKIVTTISEADGVVSETKEYLKSVTLSGYSKTNATGAIADTDTLENALSKLENTINATTVSNEDGSINVVTTGDSTDINVNIKDNDPILAKDGENGVYSTLNLVKITTGLPETVKERYELQGINGTKIGEDIDVPKDSHIVSINYITSGTHAQNLEYVYIDASGNTQTTYVDMSELVLEAEFASGVTATDHIVHGVVDSSSEKDSQNIDFLSVGGAGFKVSGIKDEIERKINALDAEATGVSSDGRVTVVVGEADGKVSGVTVTLSDIASASALTELSGSVIALSAAVESIVDGLDATVSGETDHVTVTVVEENGKLTSLTLTEDDIASADALEAVSGALFTVSGELVTEIARAKSAEAALDTVIGSEKDANSEERTYGHDGTNYLDSNDSVKEDVETLDSLLGITTTAETEYPVEFSSANTVAKSISDLKEEIAEAKSNLTLRGVDNKYMDLTVTSGASGTTLEASAITMEISSSTSSQSALVDSWDAKQYAVHNVVDTTSGANDINLTVSNDETTGERTINFTSMVVDCGEF